MEMPSKSFEVNLYSSFSEASDDAFDGFFDDNDNEADEEKPQQEAQQTSQLPLCQKIVTADVGAIQHADDGTAKE